MSSRQREENWFGYGQKTRDVKTWVTWMKGQNHMELPNILSSANNTFNVRSSYLLFDWALKVIVAATMNRKLMKIGY